MTFRTIAEDGSPLRVVLVGVGGMGQAWLQAVADCDAVALVGLVDLDTAAAEAVAARFQLTDVAVGADAVEVAARGGAQAVIDVTVPAAHHPVTTAALFAGLPVLGEKPVAASVAQGLSLAAAAQVTGELFMVSQSRRYNGQLFSFREQLAGLGRVGVLTTEFFKAPHFGGFRDAMAHPLLLDMAIHQLDSARFLLGQDPVSVYCQEFNPAWSWYAGDAGCTAIFEMIDGARYIFTGSWCSPGLETSWNGSWRGSAEFGSARWSGDDAPEVERIVDGGAVPAGLGPTGSQGSTGSAAQPAGSQGVPAAGPAEDGIAGSLREFVAALRTGTVPMGEVADNVMSLAMVEAAIESNTAQRPVSLAGSLSDALDRAIAQEQRHDVGLVLQAWRSQGRFAAR